MMDSIKGEGHVGLGQVAAATGPQIKRYRLHKLGHNSYNTKRYHLLLKNVSSLEK